MEKERDEGAWPCTTSQVNVIGHQEEKRRSYSRKRRRSDTNQVLIFRNDRRTFKGEHPDTRETVL